MPFNYVLIQNYPFMSYYGITFTLPFNEIRYDINGIRRGIQSFNYDAKIEVHLIYGYT